MYIGVDYYPEHWPRAKWETYAGLMEKARFNIVRMAEFAWVFMEPEEGRFDFSWLDDALAVLHKHGVSAILGTPTAVMPAWVARKYPETLAMQKDGQRQTWGVRKNNCFASGAYRLLSERITREMAVHFSAAPNVVGWQTDNEFGGPVCYCHTCRAEFQDWLRAKYKTLDALNRAWGTHFWGHRYGTWGEIQVCNDTGGQNPSFCLDWQRFTSWLNVRFQREQVRILRAHCPHHFVTHNFMGLYSDLNYYDLAADLDFVSWDNYPVWDKVDVPYDASAAAAVMRGLKRRNFWIMEESAGPGGWGSFGRNPRPGEIRKIAYQQMAHGADANIWFRWRTCTAGREQYWHGLLGHDGKPLRRYREAAQFAAEAHALEKELAGTTVQAPVAFIYDYESLWALRFQPGFEENKYQDALRRYFKALFRAGVNVDMVRPGQDLAEYRAVFASDLHILPDALARQLNAYVQKGGVLLADCRTGVKNENNLCIERTLPGLLSESLGITIEEYDRIAKDDSCTVTGRGGLEGRFTAVHYADWIRPIPQSGRMRDAAEVLAGYEDWHMKDFAAATRNTFGKGTGYYVGTVLKEDAFYEALIAEVLKSAHIEPKAVPPGVEVSVREGAGKRLLFLINHTEQTQTVAVPAGKRELITGKKTGAEIELGIFGVAVIKVQ
ncbi:MAG: beta-galactosidase [Planctomycetota bacterium]